MTFSNWNLSPQITMAFISPEKNTEQHISMVLEGEFDLKANEYKFANEFYGELKPKNLYQINANEKKYLYIVPKSAPKKLSFEQPGKAHFVSSAGAMFTTQLLSHSKEKNDFEFLIEISKELKKVISGEEFEFFLGILQRSVTNKIKKSDQKNKTINLYFKEEDFSKSSLEKANSISTAMCMTRTLINMPANELNPSSYEELLRTYLQVEKNISGCVDMEVFNYEKLKQEGCNLICAVGQGSEHKPRILKLSYSPKGNCKSVTLVGKGITFDSGGLDIKASSGMRHMKKDMGGSAAALGIFVACVLLKLPVRLTCYLAVAENMVSGNSMRPGDIYKTRNGLHVEIENTDAEGRLVLADALLLACEEKPDWIIDFATLTGAARVSLGPMIDSLFGNNKETSDLLYSTSIENGDWLWLMPLLSDYENYLDSSVADCVNSSSASFAGSMTAALFLQKFISVDAWNHIDTYMWCDKPHYLWQEGSAPTAKCVRLVTRAIEKFITKE